MITAREARQGDFEYFDIDEDYFHLDIMIKKAVENGEYCIWYFDPLKSNIIELQKYLKKLGYNAERIDDRELEISW